MQFNASPESQLLPASPFPFAENRKPCSFRPAADARFVADAAEAAKEAATKAAKAAEAAEEAKTVDEKGSGKK